MTARKQIMTILRLQTLISIQFVANSSQRCANLPCMLQLWPCRTLQHSVKHQSTSIAVITIVIRLRSDYDVSRVPASIRRDWTRAKNERVNFLS